VCEVKLATALHHAKRSGDCDHVGRHASDPDGWQGTVIQDDRRGWVQLRWADAAHDASVGRNYVMANTLKWTELPSGTGAALVKSAGAATVQYAVDRCGKRHNGASCNCIGASQYCSYAGWCGDTPEHKKDKTIGSSTYPRRPQYDCKNVILALGEARKREQAAREAAAREADEAALRVQQVRPIPTHSHDSCVFIYGRHTCLPLLLRRWAGVEYIVQDEQLSLS
jgi:hypothetical protein